MASAFRRKAPADAASLPPAGGSHATDLCDAGRHRPDRVERRGADAGCAADVRHPASRSSAADRRSHGARDSRLVRQPGREPDRRTRRGLVAAAGDDERRRTREFTGAPGTRVKASAMVAGERIESQEFAMPASGGVRLALVAVDPSGLPPRRRRLRPRAFLQPGNVVLGEDSRFVFEMGEDGLSVFYVLQIKNGTSTRVQPPTPLVFELPAVASGAALLEGSSPQAKVAGRRLEIAGPFPPGNTIVQVAYTFAVRRGEPGDRAAAASAADAPRRRRGEDRRHAAQLAADARAADDAGQRQALYRRPRRRVEANQMLTFLQPAAPQHLAAQRRARAGGAHSRRGRMVDLRGGSSGPPARITGASSRSGAIDCSTS